MDTTTTTTTDVLAAADAPARGRRRLRWPAVALALVVAASVATPGAAQDGAARPANPMCPVMPDEPVDEAISVVHEGERIWLCCKRCKKKFLEDPAPYLTKLPRPGGAPAADAEPGTGDHAHGHDDDHGETRPREKAEEHPHDAGAATPGHGHGGADEGHAHGGEGHDHARDHGGRPHGASRAVRWLGKLHPIAVHFPIALVLIAALAELVWIVRGSRIAGEAARFNIAVGAVGAVGAAGLGWAAGAFASYPGELASTLTYHRWVGTATTLAVVAAAVLSETARRRESARLTLAYRVVLAASAALLGLTGFLGGSLVFGPDHLSY